MRTSLRATANFVTFFDWIRMGLPEAMARGWLTRHRVGLARDEFLRIVAEIEGAASARLVRWSPAAPGRVVRPIEFAAAPGCALADAPATV